MSMAYDEKTAGRIIDDQAGVIERLEAVLDEIIEIAETSEFPDRHGIKHQACETTCLNEIAIVAKKALGRPFQGAEQLPETKKDAAGP